MQSFPIEKRFIQGPDFIELVPAHLEEQLAFAKANNVDGFKIGHEWKNSPYANLSFLPAKTIRGLFLQFEAVQDLSLINSFHQLEVLYNGSMSYPHMEIDLANFPGMRVLDINWNKNYKSLDRLENVIRLRLWKYKPKSRDLEELQNFNKLVYAVLVMPGIDSLDGIENLGRLKELRLANVRPLKEFFTTERSTTFTLEDLQLESCPHFDIDTIPEIYTLTRLALTQLGTQASLRYLLPKLPNLKTLVFVQSTLTDGNIDYLLQQPALKEVTIDQKKHYSMKEKEIQKLLEEKNN